jgi:hypothetical protein
LEKFKLTKKQTFFDNLEKSSDLNENLQSLVDFVKEQTDATDVYIGKLVYQKKDITDEAGEYDDVNMEAPKVIHYVKDTRGSMVGTVLKQE